MARCKNQAFLAKIGVAELAETQEVDFAVLADIDSCVRVETVDRIHSDADFSYYDSFDNPKDAFNCLPDICRNTGTLHLSRRAIGSGVGATFAVKEDATYFYAGILGLYVQATGAYEHTITVSDIKDHDQTNADVYKKITNAEAQAFKLLLVDFSKAPQEQKGEGWQASEEGVLITITSTPQDGQIATVGYSSLIIFESIEDLEGNDVVKIGCLENITGAFTVDATASTCFGAKYDPASAKIERTLVGKKATPNYHLLNPLIVRGEFKEGSDITTGRKEVKEKIIDGVRYGYVKAVDMFEEECAFTTVTRDDECHITEAQLVRISTPVHLTLETMQFFIMTTAQYEQEDLGTILVHESLIGKFVIVSYPKRTHVQQFVGNTDHINERRVRMSYKMCHTDGVQTQYVFNNVLITSFPGTITKEEGSFEFTISIQKDRNGNFFEMNRLWGKR